MSISFPVYRTCLGIAGVSFLGLPYSIIPRWAGLNTVTYLLMTLELKSKIKVPGGSLLWLLFLACR